MRAASSLTHVGVHGARPDTGAWVARGGALVVRALAATWRVERRGHRHDVPCLYVFRHADAVITAGAHAGCAVSVLVSLHRRSDVFAAIVTALGYDVVRGSSSRGGADAVFSLARALRRGRSVAITPDGPRGPADAVAPGVVELAGRTGVPIVPVACAAAPAWRVPSWDRLQVPLPGARVAIAYGDALVVPRDGDRERFRHETWARLGRVRTAAEAALA